MNRWCLPNLYKSLLLSPRNLSIALSLPDCTVHGVSVVENLLVVSGKSKLMIYRIKKESNKVQIAPSPSILQLTSTIEISWQHRDVFVCNSNGQSFLFYLSTHNQIEVRPSRCCFKLTPSIVVLGGNEGLYVYENALLTQTIPTSSPVLTFASCSSTLFVGCRDGNVYQWKMGSPTLQWLCHCRHAIVSLAAIDGYVCAIDAGGVVKINKSLVGVRGAQCVCSDESHFIVALKNEIVCMDCTGVVFSSLPMQDTRFLLCTESCLFVSTATQFHCLSKPGIQIGFLSDYHCLFQQTLHELNSCE